MGVVAPLEIVTHGTVRMGNNYGQLRGWLSHTPRWRAQPADLAQCNPHPAPAIDGSCQPAHARITCEVAQRRAQIDWPVAHAAECAQWLRAWLG